MRLVVVIPTIGRKDLIMRTLAHLEGQSTPPDEVFVSAPDESHVASYASQRFNVSYVFGKKGLCAQRNQALEEALKRSDVITFFDDDFLPADSYLERLKTAFQANPDCAVITGAAIYDGITGPGYQFDEGLKLLRTVEEKDEIDLSQLKLIDQVGAYGCNMSIRTDVIGTLRFDERLPLYGWQEDTDFTSQLRARGRVVKINELYGVHLGTKSGRISGVRFGYSQVANIVYLVRKGTVPPSFAYRLMVRNIIANTVKSLRPEPYIDRFGRLKGNCLAGYHVLKGHIDPEHILKL